MNEKLKNLFKHDEFNYESLIECAFPIIFFLEESEYLGDSIAILKDNNKIGFLTFSWGSCSGCDALHACTDLKDFKSLLEQLTDKIVWKDSYNEFFEYLESKDWEGTELLRNTFILEFKSKIVELKNKLYFDKVENIIKS